MTVLLVTYDLTPATSAKNHGNILEAIKQEGNWARLSESSYAIHTTTTSPTQLYERVKPYIVAGDKLLVITLSKPYMGQHSKEVVDWLASKM